MGVIRPIFQPFGRKGNPLTKSPHPHILPNSQGDLRVSCKSTLSLNYLCRCTLNMILYSFFFEIPSKQIYCNLSFLAASPLTPRGDKKSHSTQNSLKPHLYLLNFPIDRLTMSQVAYEIFRDINPNNSITLLLI